MEDGMERFMVSLPQGHPARRFLAELEGEGIQVRELEKFQEGEDDTAFEGKPFKASNNFVYDSLAAWYITRWSHASALSARRSQRRNRIDQLLDELAELPHHDVVNASPGMLADAVRLHPGGRQQGNRHLAGEGPGDGRHLPADRGDPGGMRLLAGLGV